MYTVYSYLTFTKFAFFFRNFIFEYLTVKQKDFFDNVHSVTMIKYNEIVFNHKYIVFM